MQQRMGHVITLDEYSDIGTHWIVLCTLNNKVTSFESFSVEHIPITIKHFISQKNMQTNIFRMQADDFVMCGYFCIGFPDHKLKVKGLTDFTTFFLPINFLKNG